MLFDSESIVKLIYKDVKTEKWSECGDSVTRLPLDFHVQQK